MSNKFIILYIVILLIFLRKKNDVIDSDHTYTYVTNSVES